MNKVAEELLKYWIGCRRCSSWLLRDMPGFTGCEVCNDLRRAFQKYVESLVPE